MTQGIVKGVAMMLSLALSQVKGRFLSLSSSSPMMGTLPLALDVTPSAYVTVKVPWGESGSYPMALRIEVEESDDVCGLASINLNGKKLSRDVEGHGVGSFQLNNDTIISADWDFECIGPANSPFGQSMRFNIKAVEDVGLTEEVSFWIVFRSTAPVRILDVGNADHVWSLSLPFSKEAAKGASVQDEITEDNSPHPIWEYPDREFQDPEEELQVELMEIRALREKILQLEELVRDKQVSVSKKLSKSCPSCLPSAFDRSKQCDAIQCQAQILADGARHAAHRLVNSILG